MELKPGYKQTEVGVIPEDWNVCQLRDFVDINSGESPSKYKFVNEGIPYYKVEQLNAGDKYIEETPYMLKVGKTVPAGSIIFPKRGASILLNKIRILKKDSFMDTNLMTLTTTNGLVNEYLFYCLDFQGLAKIADTTSIPQINNKHINPFRIPLPPNKTEQITIANALSDADALIQSFTRLIAKKRQTKQGAMQTLFDPYENGRLKAGWVVKEVDEIAEVRSGKRLPLGNFLTHKETNHPYIRVTDMYYGGIRLNEIMYVPNDIYPLIKNYRIFKEDIFISVAGTLGLVGKIPCELDGANLTENANRFTNIQCDRDYLLFVLSSPLIQNVIDSEKTLGAQPKLALTRIRKFKIPIPIDKQEQTRIATILSGMDAEIAALETKLAKYRHIKQGMMQNLLTGRIRLVQPESNTGAVA